MAVTPPVVDPRPDVQKSRTHSSDQVARAPAWGAFDRLLAVGLGLVGIATVLAGFAATAWWLDLFTHFHLHYFVAAVLGLALCVWRKRGRLSLLGFALVAVNAAITFAPYRVGVASAAPTAALLTLTQYNVLTENPQHAETAAYLARTEADVFCLQEISARWQHDLTNALPAYRVLAAEPRDDNYGIALMARRDGKVLDNTAQVIHPIRDHALPLGAITVRARLGEHPVNIFTLHAHPPFDANHDEMRGRLLREVARWVRKQQDPVIISGDMNATPWSTAYRRLLQATGLVSAQRYFGPQPTWLPFTGVLGGLPIDHVLHSPELKALRYAVGPDTGSDHRGVRVEFAWR